MLLRLLRRPQRQWYWIGGVAFVGATLVAFGPELKLGVSKHTAEVATKSLQDETLQKNTRELASQIVQTVLNDPKVLDQASLFIQRLVVMDVTRDALRSLVVHTLNDATTLAHVAKLARQLLAQLLDDAHTRAQVVAFVWQTLQDAQTRAALLKLLDEILKDPTTQRNLAQLLAQTFTTEPVKTSVATTIGEAVHDVLSRSDIQNHAKQFVGAVVQDQTVQAQSGDAIWGTVMYAFTPSWLAWIWEDPDDTTPGDASQVATTTATTAAAAAAVVAAPTALTAEAAAIVDEATEALADAVEKRVEPARPDDSPRQDASAEALARADGESSDSATTSDASSLVAKPNGRFEMLRRLTMRLPLISSFASGAEEDDGSAVESSSDHDPQAASHDHDHDRDRAAGSGFL